MSKNALVYAVNDNYIYIDCVANSINSFYANNPQWLVDDIEVFIITDCIELDKKIRGLLYENVKYTIIDQPSYDYRSVKMTTKGVNVKRYGVVCLWRHEILHNPIFRRFDNVLMLDSDITVEKPIAELFTNEMVPGVYMVLEEFTEFKIEFLKEQNLPLLEKCPNSGVIFLHQPKMIGGEVLDGLFNELLRANEQHMMQFIAQDDYYMVMNEDKFGWVFHELDACYNYNKYAKNVKNAICKIRHHVCSSGRYSKPYLNFFMPKSRTDVPSIYSICEKKIPVMLHQGLTSECPMGNSTIIPYKDNNAYLCGFKEFPYGLYENYYASSLPSNPKNGRYSSIYKRTTAIGYYFTLLTNSFQPYKRRFGEVTVPKMSKDDNVLEDGRLVWWDGKLYLLGCEVNKRNPMSQTASLFSVEDKDWKITLNLLYNSEKMFTGRQKNWMPIPDMPFNVVFNVGEKTTTVFDLNAGTFQEIPHRIDFCPPNLRGNTPLMRMGDKYITIVHTTVDKEYHHYVCTFDDGLHLEHISRRFVFDKFFPVEFVINMFQQNHTTNIGISVTEMDSFQFVYLVDKSKFLEFAYN